MNTPPDEVRDTAVVSDSWGELRRYTDARLALGRSGTSLPTREVLAFDLAHAQARDAVHLPLNIAALIASLNADGFQVLQAHSRASNRSVYLARPDWGRRLAAESAALLADIADKSAREKNVRIDIAIVIGDGLSSTAVQRHAAPLLAELRPLLSACLLAPIVVATQARVALADEIGELFGAGLTICIVGERPGLSTADSLGAYLTQAPKVGRNDGERNCISNIRPSGFPLRTAAIEIAALAHAILDKKTSGVALRFNRGDGSLTSSAPSK